MPPEESLVCHLFPVKNMYTPKPLLGESNELPQRLTEAFQLHYETALSGPSNSRNSKQSMAGLPACSSSTGIAAAPSNQPNSRAVAGTAASHRPSPLPALSSPIALGHVSHIGGSGLLPGTHVWASFSASQQQQPPLHVPLAPLNFPHFRVRSVLSSDSSSPQAEQNTTQQVSHKRPAAAPLPAQRPKKRGRPSRKDKAEAAAAAAAAAAVAGEAQERSRKLAHILPRASWSPGQVDCATESAAVMLRQHKARQMSASLAALSPHPALTAPAGINMLSVMSGGPGMSRETSIGAGFGLPATSPSIQGASSASCIADARSDQFNAAAAAAGSILPAPSRPNPAPEGSLREGNLDRSTSRISGISDGAAAAPSPKSVPALDWLMDKLKSQVASRTAASALRSCQEQADESNPTGSGLQKQGLSRLGLPRVGSNSSLHQMSSSGAPSSSRQSKPPASVVAAASELLARHGGISGLEMLPTVSSAKGSAFAASSWPQVVAQVESPRSQAQEKMKGSPVQLPMALFPVEERMDEAGEKNEKPSLDLDLHL